MNVSSVVVSAAKEHIQNVIDHINAVDFCEVHLFNSSGKLVVTIEGESTEEQMARMKEIQNIPDVLSVNLSYSYCEDEVTGAIGDMRCHSQENRL